MKRLVFILLLLSAPCFGYDFGFDFRNTSGFVSDPSYATYVIGANGTEDTYPTTRTVNGVSLTFGWETNAGSIGSSDRDNTLDPRIAGMNFITNGTSHGIWRVDLPASGVWSIGLGMGDPSNNQTNYLVVEDGTTPLITFAPLATSTGNTGDAAGNVWSNAAWPGSNVMVSKTFSTTILRLNLAGTADSDSSTIQHLRITQSAAPPTTGGGMTISGGQVTMQGVQVTIQ